MKKLKPYKPRIVNALGIPFICADGKLLKSPLKADAVKTVGKFKSVIYQLYSLGYGPFESCNVYDPIHEYADKEFLNSRKTVDGFHLCVSVHWEQQFGEPFWVTEVSVHYDPMPKKKYMHALFTVKAQTITDDDLSALPEIERQLIRAAKTFKQIK